MASDSNNGVLRPGAFSLSWSGGLEYGSRQMTFDGESKFYFAKGDTINEDSQTGIGVFVLTVQNADLQELTTVAKTLCETDIQRGGPETYDPPATFRVACLEDGRVVNRRGSIRKIPEKFNREIFDGPFRLSEEAWKHGAKLIKLDFTTESIEYKNGSYIVSVRFINSGNRWIRFKTPDHWPGDSRNGGLAVAPFSELGKMQPRDDWGFNLASKKILNKNEFPDGEILLNPGDSRTLKIESIPDNKIQKGGYDLSGVAYLNIQYEGYGWGLSTHVDFCPIKTRISFDRDYPSTHQEREQWEAKHRKDLSWRPVKPGQTFSEDGLYRAVRTDNGHRGLLLKPFKAGEVATTGRVTMPMQELPDVNIDGPVQWVWEATAPTPVKPWSPDLVEGTEHTCDPGAACPRSGRWLARTATRDWQYSYDLARIVTRSRGERMPGDEGTTWEWLGV
ncbi:hypothetical protein [Paraburkholderia nodosa]|uniref:hypothetical protein n=1 Tax=Paraburkholderia nodosa TaxID=392320 RepID=UPI0004ACF8B5|nr:hypothetical protein [Paraburkholderia nodosa]